MKAPSQQHKLYLILDCNFLAHRAKYVFGDLQYGGSLTGVVYGFLHDIENFCRRFSTSHVLFCWDSRERARQAIYPDYKANRRKSKTPAEIKFDKAVRFQMQRLQTHYLFRMGYRNVFSQCGRESDDLIAALASSSFFRHPNHSAIIVSSDKDLLQCIRPNVSVFTMKEVIYEDSFRRRYGIAPVQWAEVKAIAGCTSDNVAGIRGVGEKTALRYIQGTLPKDSVAYNNIVSGRKIILRNRKLVRLPFRGTKTPVVRPDRPSQKGWDEVTASLGMKPIRLEYRK